MYARYRVPFYWIVDPAVWTIDAYALEETEYRLRSAAQPPTQRSVMSSGCRSARANRWAS